MSNNTSSNKAVVPEAKGALDRFKFEVANELGVPLTDGYNGTLPPNRMVTVGGYMVKKMIEQQERTDVFRKPGRSVLIFISLPERVKKLR